jgi:DNA mismatch repair protein MutS2
LKTKTTAIAQDAAKQAAVTTGDTGAIRAEARAAVDTIVKTLTEPAARDAAKEPRPESMGAAPAVGDRVTVGSLGLEAVVTGIHDGTAELDVRGKRMRASVRDLRVIAGAPAVAGSVKVHFDLQPRETSVTDLNVIGCTVDDAISRAERFLDESLLTDQRTVRLIHGYGTGQLKRALAGFLQQHPLVARFDQAPPEQGGGGVTVVELKD